jgi:alpha-aminoadipate/glutamate carrier protein LysW
MTKANCLECDSALSIQDDAIVGEIVSCPECGADYEVASLENGTVTIKIAESVKEDWGE